jgi:hypothetical protein
MDKAVRLSQRMREGGDLGVNRICCMLHSLEPGGSTRQWVHLLGRHVEAGGEATLLGPPGPLGAAAKAAGVDVISTEWGEEKASGWAGVTEIAGRSDLAVVQWDHQVVHAFGPALAACGRAALTVHQPPHLLLRWFDTEVWIDARSVLDRAVAERAGLVFVRGAAHRRRFEEAFRIEPGKLRILPASIPLPPFRAPGGDGEILALARHSPEKSAIPRLALELTRAGLERGLECRLTVAGEGPARALSEAMCADRLPAGSWRFEDAPDDPIGRLAAADVVVAQGLTTLEAAALGRRVVVARSLDADAAAGIVLSPDCYEDAARDPFGRPEVTSDPDRLWDDLIALDGDDLRSLRRLVEAHNSLDAAAAAFRAAVSATPRPRALRQALRTRAVRIGR